MQEWRAAGSTCLIREAAKEFGLPEQEEVLMLLDLGYPTEDAGVLCQITATAKNFQRQSAICKIL